MKKLFFILMYFFSFSFFTYDLLSQQPTVEWVRNYNNSSNDNDVAYDLKVDRFGNVYVTGKSFTTTEGNNFTTIKYSSSGIQQWVRSYNSGGSGSNDLPVGLEIDTFGNVYVTGESFQNTDPANIVTIKYDNNGNQMWIRIYGSPLYNETPQDIAIDNNGNIYIIGSTPFPYPNYAALIIKYNTNGDSIWVNRKTVPDTSTGYRKMTVRDNLIYCTGICNPNSNPSTNDVFTAKLDTNGSLYWYKIFNRTTGSRESGYCLASDQAGNVYVGGSTSIGNDGGDYLLLGYDATGNFVWYKTYNGTGNWADVINGILVDNTSMCIYVTGVSYGNSTNNDYLTIKYDNNGDTLWARRYNGTGNGSDGAYCIEIDKLNNVYVSGGSEGNTSGRDAVTIKYSPDGTQIWLERYNRPSPGNGSDNANVIKLDSLNNIYITGYSDGGGNQYDFLTIKYSQTNGIIKYKNEIPSSYNLYQNYPNPFNGNTVINFEIPISGNVKITIYNILGKEIDILKDSYIKAGKYTFNFEANGYSSGIYFYKLTANNYSETKKMIIVK